MRTRQVGIALAGVVLVTSGAYVLAYLYRWEWTRAQFALLLFLVAEVALLGALILGRLDKHLESRSVAAPGDQRALEHLRASAPPARRPFAWLSPRDGQMTVFVPILMTAGILLAAVAWLVERIAGRTAVPALERGLARRLGNLALPDSLLSSDDGGPPALLLPTREQT